MDKCDTQRFKYVYTGLINFFNKFKEFNLCKINDENQFNLIL